MALLASCFCAAGFVGSFGSASSSVIRMISSASAIAGVAETEPADEPLTYPFRATGITAYLGNGGALELAQEMAAHESGSHKTRLSASALAQPNVLCTKPLRGSSVN